MSMYGCLVVCMSLRTLTHVHAFSAVHWHVGCPVGGGANFISAFGECSPTCNAHNEWFSFVVARVKDASAVQPIRALLRSFVRFPPFAFCYGAVSNRPASGRHIQILDAPQLLYRSRWCMCLGIFRDLNISCFGGPCCFSSV